MRDENFQCFAADKTKRYVGEEDPTGRGQHESGAKLDDGKLRPHLVLGSFANALSAVTEVGTFGANKYSDDGWLSTPNGINRYLDAQERHKLLYNRGQKYDQDSALLHKAHEAWNALAVLELMIINGED